MADYVMRDGIHLVCQDCGSVVDPEFLVTHAAFHQKVNELWRKVFACA